LDNHDDFGLEMGPCEKFFNLLPFGSIKISSGQVKKCSGQRQVGLLFTAGQKYAWGRQAHFYFRIIFTLLSKKLSFAA